jgi:hypothetical protein
LILYPGLSARLVFFPSQLQHQPIWKSFLREIIRNRWTNKSPPFPGGSSAHRDSETAMGGRKTQEGRGTGDDVDAGNHPLFIHQRGVLGLLGSALWWDDGFGSCWQQRKGERWEKNLRIQGDPRLFLVSRRSATPISGNQNTSSRWFEGSC